MEAAQQREQLRVATSRFGTVEIEADKIITMTAPFLGFPRSLHFFLRPHSDNSPFLWLQSVDEPDLAFVTMQSSVLLPEYAPELGEALARELQMAGGARPDLLLILTIPDGRPREMTANLLGPVALNVEKRLGRQVLLDPNRYDPCWKVFAEE
ncbi:MAG: flagellar assembly protein FliW [Thermodesulfobacteriota bacterium]